MSGKLPPLFGAVLNDLVLEVFMMIWLSKKHFHTLFICSLCRIIAVLPATSVDCERGFSNLGRIKNALRSCLQGEHLEPLMRISTMEMDIMTFQLKHQKTLILKWRRRKSRRACGKGDKVRDVDDR